MHIYWMSNGSTKAWWSGSGEIWGCDGNGGGEGPGWGPSCVEGLLQLTELVSGKAWQPVGKSAESAVRLPVLVSWFLCLKVGPWMESELSMPRFPRVWIRIVKMPMEVKIIQVTGLQQCLVYRNCFTDGSCYWKHWLCKHGSLFFLHEADLFLSHTLKCIVTLSASLPFI